jgi:hypothetical protein
MRSSPAWILYSVGCVCAGIALVAVTGGRFGIVLICRRRSDGCPPTTAAHTLATLTRVHETRFGRRC